MATIMSKSDLNTRLNTVRNLTPTNIVDHSCEEATKNESEILIDQCIKDGTNEFDQINLKNFNNDNNESNNSATNNVGINNSTYINRVTSDHGKRKKLKSRSSTVPAADIGYMKDNLDAWLEGCLKDATKSQLSSSSEFLDFNPVNQMNKSQLLLQQRIQQQQNHKNNKGNQSLNYQKQSFQQTPFGPSVLQNKTIQKPPRQQTFFAGANASSSSAFPHPNGSNVPFHQAFQRSMMPSYSKYTSPAFNNRFSFNFPSGGAYFPLNNGSQDFASLPPIVNIMGTNVDSPEHDINSTDVLDGSGINPNISQGFRFSDPCLLNPSDEEESKLNGSNNLKKEGNEKEPNDLENNKFFAALMEQINLLHETNSKICKNLHETKVDIEALKHAPNWVGMRHRRDSLSGLSTQSQPMMFGGGFSSHSPAPTYHSGSYAPGMVGELVREVKAAATVREDALLNRVKSIVEERQWSLNESNLRIMRDIEDLKSQIRQLRNERKESNKRISHLESENKYMNQILSTLFHNQHNNDIIYENKVLRPQKHHTKAKRSQSFNLHYGTLHQGVNNLCKSLEEELNEGILVNECPSSVSTTEIAKSASENIEKRTSISSADSSRSTSESVEHKAQTISNGLQRKLVTGTIPSPPNFALISSPEEISRNENLGNIPERPKETLEGSITRRKTKNVNQHELQRELNEALAMRKDAEDRIITLEKMVKNVQINARQPGLQNGPNTFSTNNLGVGSSTNSARVGTNAKVSPIKRSSIIAPTTTTIPKQKFTFSTPTKNCLINHNNSNNHQKLRHQPHSHQHSKSINGVSKPLPQSSPITDL